MSQPSKRALVLSGGGLFGAWQVGAWSVLRQKFDFDIVIGASIGSLNGWAIAGGADPADLEGRWMEAAAKGYHKVRLPLRRPLDGIVEFSYIESWIRTIHSSYRPQKEYFAVITDLMRLTPRLVHGNEVDWRHLAASCALLGVLPQQRIDRVLYSDGGLLGALPLWAARQCQSTHVIGLNVMPRMPWPVRAALRPFRISKRRSSPDASTTFVLAPSQSLGTWKDAFLWKRARVEDWVRLGRRDAETFVSSQNISLQECFRA